MRPFVYIRNRVCPGYEDFCVLVSPDKSALGKENCSYNFHTDNIKLLDCSCITLKREIQNLQVLNARHVNKICADSSKPDLESQKNS